jgi:hypothetical protein
MKSHPHYTAKGRIHGWGRLQGHYEDKSPQ